MMKKIKIQIKNRYTGSILFEYEQENNTLKDTIEKAIENSANLRYANLGYADLGGANLRGANLRYADLGGANLRGANLRYANLGYVDLGGANLRCADLRYADLGGANLRCADLGDFGELQDISIIGPIGSRKSYTTCYKTDKGIFVQCGCFKGSLDEFVTKVKETHQGNTHERDYLAMVEFVKIKFQ